MAESGKKTYRVVEVTEEELQKLIQAGLPAQALRRALIQVTDEELQKMQLSIDQAEIALTSSHHHDTVRQF
jgi:cellobiose-specific phosphotransferase system component IIA